MSMGNGDDGIRFTITRMQEGTADRVETHDLQEFPWTLVEDRAEGIFQLAAANTHGETDIGHLHFLGKMFVHPDTGLAGQARPVAEGIPRNISTRRRFTKQRETTGDEIRGVPSGQCRGYRRVPGFPHRVMAGMEAPFQVRQERSWKMANGQALHGVSVRTGQGEAAFPNRGRNRGGHPVETLAGMAIQFIARRKQGDAPRRGGLAVPGCVPGSTRQAKGAESTMQHAPHPGPHICFPEVESPIRSLELLNGRGPLLPALEIHREADAGDSVAKPIRFGDEPPRVEIRERRRKGSRHDPIVRNMDRNGSRILAAYLARNTPITP